MFLQMFLLPQQIQPKQQVPSRKSSSQVISTHVLGACGCYDDCTLGTDIWFRQPMQILEKTNVLFFAYLSSLTCYGIVSVSISFSSLRYCNTKKSDIANHSTTMWLTRTTHLPAVARHILLLNPQMSKYGIHKQNFQQLPLKFFRRVPKENFFDNMMKHCTT